MIFEITAPVWIYDGPAAWHFATINKRVSTKIKNLKLPRRGWGSVKVNATVGKTNWKTSIFPDKDGTYLLPIKKSIRIVEKIKPGENIKLKLVVIDESLLEQI